MRQVSFTWNGTRSQARAYVKSVKRTNEKKRRRALLARYAEKCRKAWSEREEWERQYFGEIV